MVVVLGAPVFTYHVHSEGAFLSPGTELFQLVGDPQAVAMAPLGTAVLTTLRIGLAQLMDRLAPTTRDPAAGRTQPPAPPATDPMSGGFVMHTVAQVMPPDAIVVEEAPTHRNAMHDHLPIRTSGGFYVGASGGLGYGMPAAVGVALGSPGRRVVCLLGDGSSLYSIQALWTAVQQRLPISFVVLNNGAYAALKAFGRALGLDQPPGVDLPGIGLGDIAAGFGCAAGRVDRAEDLEAALRSSFEAEGPTLLDIRVDPGIDNLY